MKTFVFLNGYAITKMKDMLGGGVRGGEGTTWLLALFNYDPNSITLQPGSLESHRKLLQQSDSACD